MCGHVQLFEIQELGRNVRETQVLELDISEQAGIFFKGNFAVKAARCKRRVSKRFQENWQVEVFCRRPGMQNLYGEHGGRLEVWIRIVRQDERSLHGDFVTVVSKVRFVDKDRVADFPDFGVPV